MESTQANTTTALRFTVEPSTHRVAGLQWWVIDNRPEGMSRWIRPFANRADAVEHAMKSNQWER